MFKNLHTLRSHFKTEADCYSYLENLIWPHGAACVHCGSTKVYRLKGGVNFRCGEKQCKKIFNVKFNTIFMDTKIPLLKWFEALYLATSHKKGISSVQLSKDIGITQKSAWFMLGRIRETFLERAPELLDGEIEIDEFYSGGETKNHHAKKRLRDAEQGKDNKTKVVGMLDRDGIVLTHVPNKTETNDDIRQLVKAVVKKDSTIYSDNSGIYNQLSNHCTIHSVNHTQGEYVRGSVHTNGIEGFWSQLNRSIIGIYHSVSPKHLHRYCNETAFRYNTRKCGEVERFDMALLRSQNSKLLYPTLIQGSEEKKGIDSFKKNRKPSLKLIMQANANNKGKSGNLL